MKILMTYLNGPFVLSENKTSWLQGETGRLKLSTPKLQNVWKRKRTQQNKRPLGFGFHEAVHSVGGFGPFTHQSLISESGPECDTCSLETNCHGPTRLHPAA